MIRNSAIEILLSLSDFEIKQFKLFLLSPYYNRSNKVILLFDTLVRLKSKLSKENFSQETLWLKMNTGKCFNASTLRNLFADLYHLMKKFLITEHIESQESDKEYYFLQQASSRKLLKLLEKNLRDMEDKLVSNEKVDYKFFLNMFQVKYLNFDYRYLAKWKINKESVEEALKSIEESKIALLIHFLCEIHVSEYNILNYHRSYNYDYSNSAIHKIYSVIKETGIYDIIKKKSPYSFFVEIHAALLDAYEDLDDYQKYFRSKKLVEKYADRISKSDLRNFYVILMSYAGFQANRYLSSKVFLTELFTLYKTILKKDLFKSAASDKMSYKLFRNICVIALRLKEFDWVEKFIKTYSKSLNVEEREVMVKFGLANLHYEKNELNTALNYLGKISPANRILKEDVALLNLRIFFDMKYYENLLFGIFNFKKMIKRDPILPYENKIKYEKFTGYLKLLTKLKTGYDSPVLYEDLRFKIEKDIDFFYKQWLLKRCR